ncbi:S-adenosyl-L-methionine-dependent methyltransferase [Aspergillus karnatakaensis]|uniref:class I SAM-dependent methyltransferase n=1 Tax=Aspergillus karnatakaensis TaxID=1810916 RepID=UPI003CCC904D
MQVYTTNHAPSVLHTHSWRTVQNSAPHLLPYLTTTPKSISNPKVLDVGCGPGSITIDIARLLPSAHVTGVEYVPDPLPQARDLAAKSGITNIDFQVADIHALPFPDESFDIVHVHQVLQHISDPVNALRELHRVTTRGGIVSLRESASMTWYPVNQGISAWLALTTEVAMERGGNPHPGNRIHCWAREAGFELGRMERSAGTWCFSTPEEREYWGEGMARRMEGSGFADGVVDGGFASRSEMEGIARGWREWVGDEQGWFAVLHGEVICRK